MSQSFALNDAGAPQITAVEPTVPSCGDSNGSITIVASDPTGSLEYSIDGVNFQSGSLFTDLPNGNYEATIRNIGGCTASQNVLLEGVAALLMSCTQSKSATDDLSSDGIASLGLEGGTPPYTISWTGAQTGTIVSPIAGQADVPGLKGGAYNITVIDANGCTQNCNFDISFPLCTTPLSASLEGSTAICNGDATELTFRFDSDSNFDVSYQ